MHPAGRAPVTRTYEAVSAGPVKQPLHNQLFHTQPVQALAGFFWVT